MNVYYKLEVAYDGTSYLGWQKTREGASVEQTLEEALISILKHPITLQAASRTDRGVHAKGQIVNFHTHHTNLPPAGIMKQLNVCLPPQIRILAVDQVSSSFHPTLDAKGKEYHYLVMTSRVQLPLMHPISWHIPYPLNFQKMEKGLSLLPGTHDFIAFSNRKEPPHQTTVRTLYKMTIEKEGDLLRFIIIGDNFLYRMARNIVGTLIAMGRGKISMKAFSSLLSPSLSIERGSWIRKTAPAHGLTLKKVYYETLSSPF